MWGYVLGVNGASVMGLRSQEPGPVLSSARVSGGAGSYHRCKEVVQLGVGSISASYQLCDLGREFLSLSLS